MTAPYRSRLLLPRELPFTDARERRFFYNYRGAGADDVLALVNTLGGNTAVPAFYDVRRNVTATTTVSAWDDARGASGFGPQLAQATALKRPAWDADALAIGFTAASQQELHTATSSLFDLGTAKTVVLVGAVGGGTYAAALADSTSANRLLAVHGGTNIGAKSFPGGVSAFTTVTVGTTRRVCLATTSAATALKAEVPDAAAATATITAHGAGDNALTLGTFFTGSSSFATLTARAVIVLAGAYTTAQRDAIAVWAVKHHATVAAS